MTGLDDRSSSWIEVAVLLLGQWGAGLQVVAVSLHKLHQCPNISTRRIILPRNVLHRLGRYRPHTAVQFRSMLSRCKAISQDALSTHVYAQKIKKIPIESQNRLLTLHKTYPNSRKASR
jgi:hypothetical protein